MAGGVWAPPYDPAAFAAALDTALRRRNTYYDDLRRGNILVPLQLTPLPAGAFQRYMKSLAAWRSEGAACGISSWRQGYGCSSPVIRSISLSQDGSHSPAYH